MLAMSETDREQDRSRKGKEDTVVQKENGKPRSYISSVCNSQYRQTWRKQWA